MIYRIKVIIIGEAGVGKTSLVKKFVSNRFTQDYRASIGANLFIKELNLNSNVNVSIQIWDIAGQERWKKMRHLYYKGALGALVIGDITRKYTFNQLKEFWNQDLLKYCGDIPKILVVNKIDLDPVISNNEVEKVAQNINVISTIFTSAKNGQNVDKAFNQLTEEAVKNKV